MNLITYASVLTAIVLLTGCAAQQTQPMGGIRAPKVKVIGIAKDELLACAGAPTREERERRVERLVYVTSPGFSPGEPMQAVRKRRRICEATVSIQNNTVEKIEYQNGRGEPVEPEQCAPIFERCKR
jgi:hypothetical protein